MVISLGGTLPADDPNISLNADGSAEFKGDVAIGDSATRTLGDLVARLAVEVQEKYKDAIAEIPLATPYDGDASTLPADLPTPLKDALVRVTTAGKINLNSDGSAQFAGRIRL